MEFIKQLINGLSIGSIYALVALGYTMVYGIVQLINFAHGDIIMVGSYAVLLSMRYLGLPFWLSILISMVFCAVSGVLIERIAYRPLRNKSSIRLFPAIFKTKRKSSGTPPRISALITAIGVSLFLQNAFSLIFSATPRPFPNAISGMVTIGPENSSFRLEYITVVSIATSVVLMILLNFFISRTKMGKAMRAVSEDSSAAVLMGINVNTTISITFAVGSALAAVGGALYSAAYPSIDPFMGATFGLKAFIAAVLGGIGIVPGAMFGGFIMGIAESFTKGYITSRLSDAVVFSILIIVLLIKPAGIFGTNVKEKV